MSTRSTILIATLAFAGGWVSAKRFSAPSPQPASVPAPSFESIHGEAKVRPSENPPQPSAKVTPTLPSEPNAVVFPEDAPDADRQLADLIRDRFPEAKMIVRRENPDGTFLSRETLEDGSTISRNFSSRGSLTDEDWRQATGDEIIRSYFGSDSNSGSNSASLREFSLKRNDGTATTITFSSAGFFKTRADDLLDGSHVYVNYDDHGKVFKKWRKEKDGTSVPIQ